jgi:hypothetical protein
MACIATLLIVSHVFRLVGTSVCRSVVSWFRKHLVQAQIYRRRNSTDSLNLLSLGYICIYIGANITLCIVGIKNREALAKRCGMLCLINLIPLSVGGRLSFLAHILTRARPWNLSLAHRWMGRVCLLEGAIHGILSMLVERATVKHILVGLSNSTLCACTH